MKHDAHNKNDPPWAAGTYMINLAYPTFAAFNNDLQNPGVPGAGQFWNRVNNYPYALQDIRNNADRIRDKWNQKLANDIAAEIRVGRIGDKYLIVVSAPNRPNSRDHAYLFFPTANAEVLTELNLTWL